MIEQTLAPEKITVDAARTLIPCMDPALVEAIRTATRQGASKLSVVLHRQKCGDGPLMLVAVGLVWEDERARSKADPTPEEERNDLMPEQDHSVPPTVLPPLYLLQADLEDGPLIGQLEDARASLRRFADGLERLIRRELSCPFERKERCACEVCQMAAAALKLVGPARTLAGRVGRLLAEAWE